MHCLLMKFACGRCPFFLLAFVYLACSTGSSALAQEPQVLAPSSFPLSVEATPSNSIPAAGVATADPVVHSDPALQDDVVESPMVKKRMTSELLLKHGRLGGASVSPDGTQVAYTVREYDLEKIKVVQVCTLLIELTKQMQSRSRIGGRLDRWTGLKRPPAIDCFLKGHHKSRKMQRTILPTKRIR